MEVKQKNNQNLTLTKLMRMWKFRTAMFQCSSFSSCTYGMQGDNNPRWHISSHLAGYLSQQKPSMEIPAWSVALSARSCSQSNSWLQNNVVRPHRCADQLHSLVFCWLMPLFWLELLLDLLDFWHGANQEIRCYLYVTQHISVDIHWWMKVSDCIS